MSDKDLGSHVLNKEGEEVEIKKAVVGGTQSEGMLCDSRMLGWSGGAEGIAAQMPESLTLGAAPPPSKPRPNQENASTEPVGTVEGLFAKKLSKEEKKKIAEEKRRAKKAAKEAKKASEDAL